MGTWECGSEVAEQTSELDVWQEEFNKSLEGVTFVILFLGSRFLILCSAVSFFWKEWRFSRR